METNPNKRAKKSKAISDHEIVQLYGGPITIYCETTNAPTSQRFNFISQRINEVQFCIVTVVAPNALSPE